ncbi:DUF3304 domain-containing protein [Pseudomonas putida]|uniref:DUF3304 domain-containing protein n=1 Tax=Pseudomonas putida TaxID=303 RepID=UPI000952C9FF|nr:DUF3304 domain-containing protein [Pseudomonas putida]
MKVFVRARLATICVLVCAIEIPAVQAGIIEGVNHTHWAINKFSVDGHSALDTIGPWQRGGGGYFSLPARWELGMTVRVDWQTGVSSTEDFPGFADWPKALAWAENVKAQRRNHSRSVLVPNYSEQKTCGITVHFLPCDEIEVATSCYGYGHPEYPVKTPLNLPEPQSCPK